MLKEFYRKMVSNYPDILIQTFEQEIDETLSKIENLNLSLLNIFFPLNRLSL
jgi:hemoglobin-like flavoprotein